MYIFLRRYILKFRNNLFNNFNISCNDEVKLIKYIKLANKANNVLDFLSKKVLIFIFYCFLIFLAAFTLICDYKSSHFQI